MPAQAARATSGERAASGANATAANGGLMNGM